MDISSLINSASLTQLGGGTLAGVAVGYAAKRAAKLALLLLGLVLIGLYFLAQQGWVTVHWQTVTQEIEEGSRGAGQWMSGLIRDLSPSLVGLAGGFAIGLRIR